MDHTISVPVKLLFEGIKHVITVETKNGESYRGELAEAETNMNLQMSDVIHTARNGQKRRLEFIFIRGGNIKFVVFPNLLIEATIFRKVTSAKNKYDKIQEAKAAAVSQGRRPKK